MMQEVKVLEKDETQIVFASREDLRKFYNDIIDGKTVLLTWETNGEIVSELLSPNNSPKVNDGSVKLMSREIKQKGK
jgi:hypothetical protein